jgi:hypothetical protein
MSCNDNWVLIVGILAITMMEISAMALLHLNGTVLSMSVASIIAIALKRQDILAYLQKKR